MACTSKQRHRCRGPTPWNRTRTSCCSGRRADHIRKSERVGLGYFWVRAPRRSKLFGCQRAFSAHPYARTPNHASVSSWRTVREGEGVPAKAGVEPRPGIEPGSAGSEPDVLPLDDLGSGGAEARSRRAPSTWTLTSCTCHFAPSVLFRCRPRRIWRKPVVGRPGIEPGRLAQERRIYSPPRIHTGLEPYKATCPASPLLAGR